MDRDEAAKKAKRYARKAERAETYEDKMRYQHKAKRWAKKAKA